MVDIPHNEQDNEQDGVRTVQVARSALTMRQREQQQRLAAVAAKTRSYVQHASSVNTRRAYRSDWEDFMIWCQSQGLPALPATPETVALYLSALAEGCKPSTLQRRLVAIRRMHRAAQVEPPTTSIAVQETMKGIRRVHGSSQTRKQPAITPIIRDMIVHLPATIFGIRDRALLLLGFAAALRRSELVSLNYADLKIQQNGLVVTLRRSKTDQEGVGRTIGIPYGKRTETCPVRATQTWIAQAAITDGPLFRRISKSGRVLAYGLSDKAVATIVKRTAAAAGYDPEQFAGHSLRAGLATQAAIGGASERAIMKQTGHHSLEMVRRYIRDGDVFRENAADFADL